MSNIWIPIFEKDAILDGLRHLRLYTEGMFVAPDSSLFSDEINKQIIRYYRSKDPVEDITYQKILGTAIIKTVNDNPDVYGPKKDKVSVRCAKEFVECLKTSKEYYQATCRYGKYENKSQQEINQLLKESEENNRVVQKAHLIHKAKNVLKKYPKRLATKAAIGKAVAEATGSVKIGTIIATASLITDAIIPLKIKKDIHEKAKKANEWVKTEAKKVWTKTETYLDKTEVGSIVKDALVVTGTVVKGVAEGIKEVAHGAVELAGKGLKAVGKFTTRLFTKAKTLFA